MNIKLLSLLSTALVGLSLSGCSSAPVSENTGKTSEPFAVYHWIYTWTAGTTPVTTTLYPPFTSMVCEPQGYGGQTGGTPGSFVIGTTETSPFNWITTGSATPSGWAPAWTTVVCAENSAFSGQNFDHIFVGPLNTLPDATYPEGVVTLSPTSPTPTNGNSFFGISVLGGDYTTLNTYAKTMYSVGGGNYEMVDDMYASRLDSNSVGSYGFQLQDASNNPITPTTVGTYSVTAGGSTNLPWSETAFCFLTNTSGPLNNSTRECTIVNPELVGEATDQVLTSTAGGCTVVCINYQL